MPSGPAVCAGHTGSMHWVASRMCMHWVASRTCMHWVAIRNTYVHALCCNTYMHACLDLLGTHLAFSV